MSELPGSMDPSFYELGYLDPHTSRAMDIDEDRTTRKVLPRPSHPSLRTQQEAAGKPFIRAMHSETFKITPAVILTVAKNFRI